MVGAPPPLIEKLPTVIAGIALTTISFLVPTRKMNGEFAEEHASSFHRRAWDKLSGSFKSNTIITMFAPERKTQQKLLYTSLNWNLHLFF